MPTASKADRLVCMKLSSAECCLVWQSYLTTIWSCGALIFKRSVGRIVLGGKVGVDEAAFSSLMTLLFFCIEFGFFFKIT